MTQKEKQLLLKDLCARLPYGVKVQVYSDNMYAPAILTSIDVEKQECIFNFNVPVEYCLPYLRPMSSMNEEAQFQLGRLLGSTSYNLLKGEYSSLKELLGYFYKNHFDYLGLIPMGLALEAPEGMYKN